MTKSIEIEIYGHRYTITGEAEEDYIRRLAKHVDEQMRGVAQGMKTATFAKLALLAAINITDQLFQAEQRRRQGELDVERRAHSLMASIEEQLQPSRVR